MSPVTVEDIEVLVDLVLDDLSMARRPKVKVSTRKTRNRLGTTWAAQNRITLYWPIMKDWPLDGIEDVIRHELAHVTEYRKYGTISHGPNWRSEAERLGAYPRANSELEPRLEWAASRTS